MTTLFYILSLLGIVVLGLATFINRSDKKTGYFSLMSFAIAAWLAIQFVAIRAPGLAYALTITGLVAFSFITPFAWLFIAEFTEFTDHKPRFVHGVFVGSLLILVVTSVIPGTITSAEVVGGSLVVTAGPLYSVQSAVALLVLVAGIALFMLRFRKFTKQQRSSSYFLISGFVVALVGSVLSGYFFADKPSAQFAAPLSLFLMTAIISYAVSKHSLFDVRLVVVRSIGYLASLGVIGVVAALGLFKFSSQLTTWQVSDTVQQWFYVLFTLILAVLYIPLKVRFDKLTRKLFYRDAYDSPQLIDDINKALVSTLDLETMLRRVNEVIARTVKAEFSAVALEQTAYQSQRVVSSKPISISRQDIAYLSKVIPSMKTKVLVTDRLSETNARLQQHLHRNDVGILVRLAPDSDATGTGYMLLGFKLSGNPYTPQDISILDTIGNALLIAIQNALSYEEIQQFNVTLQQKIDNATKQLKHANDKLVELNDTKDDFISMASHQLRTPLTAVKGNISMIMDEDFGKVPKTVQEPLGQAYASSERMVGLIADLLNVSRLKTGKFAIQPVASNLDTVVKSELKQLQEAAKAHHLTLRYHEPKSFPALMLDEIKVRQVIMNFIDNAIYYTPAGGHIDVTLKHKPAAIEFTVEDDGIGVPRDLQRNLFTKFYRADNAQKMRPDGTGIGLFMAKKVIVASGGSVIFRSTEGKGSTFGFTIPLSKLPKPPPTQA